MWDGGQQSEIEDYDSTMAYLGYIVLSLYNSFLFIVVSIIVDLFMQAYVIFPLTMISAVVSMIVICY